MIQKRQNRGKKIPERKRPDSLTGKRRKYTVKMNKGKINSRKEKT